MHNSCKNAVSNKIQQGVNLQEEESYTEKTTSLMISLTVG